MWWRWIVVARVAAWWYRFRCRQLVRMAATRHLATIAHGLWTGSTQAYTLCRDLPRYADSTTILWEDEPVRPSASRQSPGSITITFGRSVTISTGDLPRELDAPAMWDKDSTQSHS